MKQASFDILGNIALVKFQKGTGIRAKKEFAKKLLKRQKSVKTALEKTGRFKGRLRKQKTKYIAGEKTKEALYRENGCVFRFNIDSCYFSPRLSNEREEISKMVKKGYEVLVMFAGVGPYPIVIAKNSKAKKVYSNKIKKGLTVDDKRVPAKFDIIVMPRPQLKDTFLHEAFSLSKNGTKVFYYDFCKEEEIPKIVEKIKSEALSAKKKIKVLKIKKAGEIAPYKFRIRVDFRVL